MADLKFYAGDVAENRAGERCTIENSGNRNWPILAIRPNGSGDLARRNGRTGGKEELCITDVVKLIDRAKPALLSALHRPAPPDDELKFFAGDVAETRSGELVTVEDGHVRGKAIRIRFDDGRSRLASRTGRVAGKTTHPDDLVAKDDPTGERARARAALAREAVEAGALNPNDKGDAYLIFVANGYRPLANTLAAALSQAQAGKGRERHANGRPFDHQPILEIGRMLSSTADGELFQAIKKAQEASGMLARQQHDAAERELLGAINYLAAAVLLIREDLPDIPF